MPEASAREVVELNVRDTSGPKTRSSVAVTSAASAHARSSSLRTSALLRRAAEVLSAPFARDSLTAASAVAWRADISDSVSATTNERSGESPYFLTMPLAVCQLPPVEICPALPAEI